MQVIARDGSIAQLEVDDHLDQTPVEDWTITPTLPHHWYTASTEYALKVLGAGNGRSCLVIGSPLFEVLALQDAGWRVTYLDCREPPDIIRTSVLGDAIKMPFPDQIFDAVSSACVLCHAGLGRYGDAVIKDGDKLMLQEIHRVLKSRAIGALTFGPTALWLAQTIIIGTTHRLYSMDNIAELLSEIGLNYTNVEFWSSSFGKENDPGIGKWLTHQEILDAVQIRFEAGVSYKFDYYYSSVQITKR